MTHPFGEVIAAAAIVLAVGAGAAFVLPADKAPLVSTNAARVEALQRQVIRLAAEQKRLTEDVKAATAVARGRKKP